MPNFSPTFLALIVVILVARLGGLMFRKMRQPPVMGEVLGGILLGPSVLGHFFPQTTTFLFHPDALVFLNHVAEIGVSLYLFVMGLEIDGQPAVYVRAVPDPSDASQSQSKLATLAAMAKRGDVLWFIKINGDRTVVTTQEDAFKSFLKSLRFAAGSGATDGHK